MSKQPEEMYNSISSFFKALTELVKIFTKKIKEGEVKLIPLTQGKFAKVSDRDYEWLSQWKWMAAYNPRSKTFYVARSGPHLSHTPRRIFMHRLILNLKPYDGVKVDHRDHDGLNNTRENIRKASNSQNCCNKKIQTNNTSGQKGVNWNKVSKRWVARVKKGGKYVFSKTFLTRELAVKAYREAVIKFHGEFTYQGEDK